MEALCAKSAALLMWFLLSTSQVSSGSSEKSPEHQCLHTWFFWNETSQMCECGPNLYGLQCIQSTKEIQLYFFLSMTYDNVSGATTVGRSHYSDLRKMNKETQFSQLPQNVSQLNQAVCGGVNREGFLCSKCKPGHGAAPLSYNHECAECSHSHLGWIMYICMAMVPTTLFLIIIIVCQIRTTSASLNFHIFACQAFAVFGTLFPQLFYSQKIKIIVGVFSTFFTMWNLDFFRLIIPPFCVSEHISNLQIVSMDYIIAIYPLLLTAIMYVCIQQHAKGCRTLVCLWRPFGYCFSHIQQRYKWNPATSTVHAFASFLTLSSAKFLFVSVNLIQNIKTTTLTSDGLLQITTKSVYYDPHLSILDQNHLPYAILAISMCVIFVILPCVLLVLYPTRLFQGCLNHCGIRWHAIHAFADAFNGCYKNGTNGTQDCRYFAGFYLFLKVFYMATYQVTDWEYYSLMLKISTTSALLVFVLAFPYRSRFFNIVDTVGLALMMCRFCILEYRGIFNVLGLLWIAVYLIVYLSCKAMLTLHCPCSQKLKVLARKLDCDLHIEREGEHTECSLPAQVVNPNHYQPLPGNNE